MLSLWLGRLLVAFVCVLPSAFFLLWDGKNPLMAVFPAIGVLMLAAGTGFRLRNPLHWRWRQEAPPSLEPAKVEELPPEISGSLLRATIYVGVAGFMVSFYCFHLRQTVGGVVIFVITAGLSFSFRQYAKMVYKFLDSSAGRKVPRAPETEMVEVPLPPTDGGC